MSGGFERHLDAILDHAGEAITVQEPSGRLVYANLAAARSVGYPTPAAMLTAQADGSLARRFLMRDERGEPVPFEQLPGRRALATGEQTEPVLLRWRDVGTDEERWSEVKASPVLGDDGRPAYAINVWHDVTADTEARIAARFLADSSRLLARTLDLRETLQLIADLAVPELADWCSVDVPGPDGAVQAVAFSAATPELRERVVALQAMRTPDDPRGSANVMRTGEREVYLDVPPELLETQARSPEHLELMRAVGLRSGAVVPMLVRGRPIGVISLATCGERRMRPSDPAVMEELAGYCALAVQNARLYDDARRRAEQLRELNEASLQINAGLGVDQMRPVIARHARVLTGAQHAVVLLAGEAEPPPPAPGDPVLDVGLVARDGGELGTLRATGTFTEDDEGALRQLGHMASLAIENARLSEDRAAIARTLQASLLPPDLPRIPGIRVAARYRPAGGGGDVGGDFYDLFDLGGETWAVVLGDVCGKGAPAAAMTALARYTTRAVAPGAAGPSAVLAQLNDAVLHADPEGLYATALYATLRLGAAPVVTVASAGHPLPVHLPAGGEPRYVGAAGMLLGLSATPRLHDVEVTLAAGDRLLLFTDGLTEGAAPARILDDGELLAAVAGCAGAALQDVAEAVERAALGDAEPRDDIAIVVLEVAGATAG